MAGAEEIIRELLGIGGLYNPNLYIDSTIISLVFKADYMLQLKEASAGSLMGTATGSQARRVWKSFRRGGLVCGTRELTNCPGGSGGTVESCAYAKHGRRCINMDRTQRNIFIYN